MAELRHNHGPLVALVVDRCPKLIKALGLAGSTG
jgi:hypothetical protein